MIALNTAGVTLQYAVEATAGTRPTSGYTALPGLKSVPELNPEPGTLESTDLSETEYVTYIEDLKDLGGALGFNFNFNDEVITAWETLVSAYETAKAGGKSVWFNVVHPGITKSVFFTGQPVKLGMPGAEVRSVYEGNCYIVPTNAPTWEEKATVSE